MKLLEKFMTEEGFIGWPLKWWHFDLLGWNNDILYPPMNIAFEDLKLS